MVLHVFMHRHCLQFLLVRKCNLVYAHGDKFMPLSKD